MMRFWVWFTRSVSDPHNLPHWLLSIFTLALAVFACYAWLESQRATRALEGQLAALKAEQRPFLWLLNIEQPQFDKQGQIFINWMYKNYGKGIAYNIFSKSYMKTGGNGLYDISHVVNDSAPIRMKTGVQSPPEKVDFATVISRPGLSEEYVKSLLNQDRSIGVMIELYYSNANGEERYMDAVCVERLGTGAWTFLNPEDCHKR